MFVFKLIFILLITTNLISTSDSDSHSSDDSNSDNEDFTELLRQSNVAQAKAYQKEKTGEFYAQIEKNNNRFKNHVERLKNHIGIHPVTPNHWAIQSRKLEIIALANAALAKAKEEQYNTNRPTTDSTNSFNLT